MKEIIEYIEKKSYQTSDGTIFTSKTEALKHQRHLDVDNHLNELIVKHQIRSIPNNIYAVCELGYFGTKEEVLDYMAAKGCHYLVNTSLTVPGWCVIIGAHRYNDLTAIEAGVYVDMCLRQVQFIQETITKIEEKR